MHQKSPAQALFAGFRTYLALPCVLHAFAAINTDVNHFCLCRPDTTCTPEARCIDAVRPRPIDSVR